MTERTNEPTAAEVVASRLAEAGAQRAFGVPGGEVLALIDALDRAGVAFTLVKHENAGGFMAEGFSSPAGDPAPGVLVCTIGPGLLNAANVAANALQDQVPLIILSGAAGPEEAATYTHQVLDQCAAMRPVVKASFSLADGAVDVLIDRALRTAVEAPQGPVHVDLATALATRRQPTRRRPSPAPIARPTAPAPGPDLDAARAFLAGAERPLILAGVGAAAPSVVGRSSTAIRSVAERFGAPVLTTYKAKGLLPETHRLSVGGHGLSPKSDAIIGPLLADADCVLAVGYDPIEMRHGWREPFSPDRCIEIAHSPNRHGMHGAAHAFVCDPAAGLEAVAGAAAPSKPTWPDGRPSEIREALRAAFGDRPNWGPHAAFAALRRVCPPETILTADSGAHRILLSQAWETSEPKTLLQSSAFCTMACALPLAMGRKLREPDRPVVAVMGDAGLEMTMGELATLRDLRIGLPIVVLVDQSLALIELKQRRSQLPNLGVDFGGTDFPGLARALGGVGAAVADVAALELELSAALERRDRFTLIAVEIGPRAYDDAF